MMKKIENKSMVDIHGLKPGGQVEVNVDRDGTPIDKNWRRRIKDDDGAIVFVKGTKPVKSKEV